MKNQSRRYQVPTETEEDRKQFHRYNNKIKELQDKLTKDPTLAFSDVIGYITKISAMRKHARSLNSKYRLSREVN